MHLREDVFELLKNVEIFQGLTDEQLNQLVSVAEEVTLNTQDYLFKEGDATEIDTFYVIQSGYVDVSKRDRNNIEYNIRTLTKGEVLGETSFITHKPRSATIQAYSQVQLLKFSLSKINFLNNPSLFLMLSKNAANILADRLDYAYKIIIETIGFPALDMPRRHNWFKTIFFIILLLFLLETAVLFYIIS